MTKDRRQVRGIRREVTGGRRQGVAKRFQFPVPCSLSPVFCLLLTVYCLLSTAVAASWSPEEVLRVFLADNYPWEKIEARNVSVEGDIPVRTPDMITVEKGPLGKGIFAFIYDGDRKVTVKADVRALDVVVKSKRPFRKGYVLQDDDVYLSEKDINKMPKSAVSDPETIIGKPLKRSILADMIIVEDMIEKTQTVNKGKKVVLLISGKGFNITAAGEIREKGYVGEQVKAVNLSSKKEVRGVLVDENTVRVEL